MDEIKNWMKSHKDSPNIYGRICSGNPNNPSDKLYSLSLNRSTTFLFGKDALELLFQCKSGYDFEILLGFTHDYIYNDVLINKTPQILVLLDLKQSNHLHFPIELANWDGVGKLLKEHYPLIYSDYLLFITDLKSTSYSEFEKMAGFPFYSALKQIDGHEYMDADKYLNLCTPRKIWQFRLFLYCEFRLLELYGGEGYTIAENVPGNKLLEYLALNITLEKLTSISDVLEIPLPMNVPEKKNSI